LTCPQCQSSKTHKYGKVKGVQRRKCTDCGFQYTRPGPKGKPLWMKLEACLLYMTGISFNAIGAHLAVSAQAVLDWVKAFAIANYEKPEPASAVVVELDEMWHFIKKKARNAGYGKPLIVIAGDSLTGSLEIAMLKR
jgi:transposase-like protein